MLGSSLRFDGSAYRTMLRNDAYWFSRLGVYIERADNTARILDVKYHLLLPAIEKVGGPLDYYQWTSILRTVSALTAYHWVYRENVKPWLVADLLILKDEMPRSLASCYENLVQNLDRIANAYGRQGPAQRHARTVRARLENCQDRGDFPERIARIHRRIRRGQQPPRHRRQRSNICCSAARTAERRRTVGLNLFILPYPPSSSVCRRPTCACASPTATSTATIRRPPA